MSNILELLKDINLDLDHSSYVYYNDDGSIAKISNRHKDGDNYKILKVPYFQVESIMTGVKKLEDFKVTYDLSVKSFILKEITYEEKLVSIEQRLFELPSYKKNLELFTVEEDIVFQEIYENLDVFVYIENESYKEGSFIYFNENVYKLKFDIYNNFNIEDHELYVKNVVLVDFKSNIINLSTVVEPIYSGIFIDVWYDELEHLEGQHVWYDNCVFRMNKYQPKNTKFNVQNADLIVDNILLNDKNNMSYAYGDKFLSNNHLYTVNQQETQLSVKNKVIKFYLNSLITVISEDASMFVKLNKRESNFVYEVVKCELKFYPIKSVMYGQKVLIGKNLFIARQLHKGIDVTIIQDNNTKSWKVLLNKITRKSLIDTGYNFDDKLSFSITARHDPNILYRTLNFHLKDLINDVKKEYPFIYDWEFNGENVSIYTPKYFENYIHEILE